MLWAAKFDVVSTTDFTKGFTYSAYTWKIDTLSSRSRSREFSIAGCAGIKWTMAVEKKTSSGNQTTIGLHCKDAPMLIPAAFRIAIYDAEDVMLMNRSCFFAFNGGSSGCGFTIDNWTVLEHRLRLLFRPLIAYLFIDVPRDKSFFGVRSPVTEPSLMYSDHMSKLRDHFKLIEDGSSTVPFSDVSLTVESNDQDDGEKVGEGMRTETIQCHRSVLSLNSPVFDRMLKSDFRESTGRAIDLSEDMDRATMIATLRYMYCGEIGRDYEEFKVELSQIINLLNAAEKYEMIGLKKWCESCLIMGYDTDEQRRMQLRLADMFDLRQLRQVSMSQLSTDPVALDEKVYTSVGVNASDVKLIQKRMDAKYESNVVELKS